MAVGDPAGRTGGRRFRTFKAPRNLHLVVARVSLFMAMAFGRDERGLAADRGLECDSVVRCCAPDRQTDDRVTDTSPDGAAGKSPPAFGTDRAQYDRNIARASDFRTASP